MQLEPLPFVVVSIVDRVVVFAINLLIGGLAIPVAVQSPTPPTTETPS